MSYGYFDNQNKEYVITRPDTPTPWINYLGSGQYSGIISNTGGGLSFDGDPSNRRVTRYKFNNLPIDRPGRYLYIRNEETGEYWSPTWQPVMKALQQFECRHGLGYTKITGTYDDIETSITYLVPDGKNYELWQVEMKNLSDKPKKLKIFSYVEFSWHDAKYDMLCHWPCMAFKADFEQNKIVVDTVAEHLTDLPLYSYIAGNLKIDGYDCSLEKFIGNYRSESNPAVLETGKCTGSSMYSDNCIGVLASSVCLEPGETKRFCYTLGAASKKEDIDLQIVDAFCETTQNNALAVLKAGWDKTLSCLQVETPSSDMNTMLNIWHVYQANTTFNWSRFISLYERGVDRGFGFRDSMQDILGVMHVKPEAAKEKIKLLLSIQNSDGGAREVYFPATKEWVGGGRSDDHLWSILSVCNYIRETGDNAFAHEAVPYTDGSKGSVLEHLVQGLEFTMANLGPHGIPSMLRGDWDDSLSPMNKKASGESVFVFFQLAHGAYEMTKLYRHLGLTDKIARMQEIYEYCRSKLPVIWDGQWFIRAFTPEGEKYCTKDDTWSKIHMIPQAWGVLSRLPTKEQSNLAMDCIMKELMTDYGMITHAPAYTGFKPEEKGYYLFPAGARENGGIFFHSNSWVIIALAMLNRNDEAFRCYESILPTRRNENADLFRTEPYVYSQTMVAPPHDRAGTCVNSWLTGTASWVYYAATQYLLGVCPEYEGLVIEPHVPKAWENFAVTRLCRGTRCYITVKKGGETGLFLNGERMKQSFVPWERLKDLPSAEIELVLSRGREGGYNG